MNHLINRRSFLEFLGKGSLVLALSPTILGSCAVQKIPFAPIGIDPSSVDDLVLAEGLEYEVLISWKDAISDNDYFGFNNDYIAFLPTAKDEGLLWINHEYVQPLFVTGHNQPQKKNKEAVEKEMYHVGGTFVQIKKQGDHWKIIHNHPSNRRIHALTEMSFNWDTPIAGSMKGLGTLANCSGGITPWGTILTCEENYDYFYGERTEKGSPLITKHRNSGWEQFYDQPTEHYGWVVEIDPSNGNAQKHIALGRCSHECATVHELSDGRVVVYTGDDHDNECIYKFISSKKGSLKDGTLYVANLESGQWEALDLQTRPALQKTFDNQTEVLTYLRQSSKMVGGTPMDRPEDIEIDPIHGYVLISLTNNKSKGNYHGSLLKLSHPNNDHESLTFTHETFLAGGVETGFSCPDNMAFDPKGNLWFTSDIAGNVLGKNEYESFKNNGLFLVPRSGQQAGKVIQIASAPNDAELTGPFFTPDGLTLFLSVQHPGETTKDLSDLKSNWPEGGDAIPKPSVVTISGPFLQKLMMS